MRSTAVPSAKFAHLFWVKNVSNYFSECHQQWLSADLLHIRNFTKYTKNLEEKKKNVLSITDVTQRIISLGNFSKWKRQKKMAFKWGRCFKIKAGHLTLSISTVRKITIIIKKKIMLGVYVATQIGGCWRRIKQKTKKLRSPSKAILFLASQALKLN